MGRTPAHETFSQEFVFELRDPDAAGSIGVDASEQADAVFDVAGSAGHVPLTVCDRGGGEH